MHSPGDVVDVVVVESPAKAKTIRKYLGEGYRVFATRGHVRDLLAKEGSVNPAQDFATTYVSNRRAVPALRSIAAALKDANSLVQATDPQQACQQDIVSGADSLIVSATRTELVLRDETRTVRQLSECSGPSASCSTPQPARPRQPASTPPWSTLAMRTPSARRMASP